MGLMDDIASRDKSGLLSSDDNTVSYPTGFLALDYANGYESIIRQYETGNLLIRKNLGIPKGTIVSVIGNPGTGKSTLAFQVAWNIVAPFPGGGVFYVDCEKTMNKERVDRILGIDFTENRMKLLKGAVSIEEVLHLFRHICAVKKEKGKEYMYLVPDGSYDGQPYYEYVPTVMIIDSLPSFNSKEYEIETLGTNVDQMRAAKDITRFFTNFIDDAWKYNIILMTINHVRKASQLNQFETAAPGLLMLNPKQETLPRGSAAQYFSSTYFRLTTTSGKANMYTEEDNGFAGAKVTCMMAKSKTNNIGRTFPLSLNWSRGFDPYYSMFEFAQSLDIVCGRNPHLYLPGMEDMKFSRREFANLMYTNEEFRMRVTATLLPFYDNLLDHRETLNTAEIIPFRYNNECDITPGGLIVNKLAA